MKKLLFTVLIITTFRFIMGANINLTNEEKEWLSDHKTIRIAPDPEFPPIEWIDENGLYRGISSGFMDLISQELDIEFEVVQYNNWEEVLQKARDRDVDMLSAAAQTPQRAKYMDFSSPYLIFPGVMITRNDYSEIKTIEQLYNKKVVIVSGYVWQDMLTLDHPEIEIIQVNSLLDGLRGISMGVHDVIIATLPIALYYIEKEGIHNLRVSGETDYFTKLSILTRKDWPMLGTIMQKTLSNIPGKKKKDITKKWITIKRKSVFSNKQFWIILISILFISFVGLIIIYTWNRILKKLVRKRTRELEEDIAKRKITEKALVTSEEKFRVLYNNSPDMYVSVSPEDGIILLCNETLLKKTGYSREEIIGFPIFKLYHEDCLPDVENNVFKKFIKTGVIRNKELILKRKDGSKIDISLNVDAVRDKAGKILYSISSWRDITERKKAEDVLRDNEQSFRDLVDNLLDGLAIADEKGYHIYVNPKFSEITGYSRDELLNMTGWDFTHPEDLTKLKQRMKGRMADKPIKTHYERIIVRKDGVEILVEMSTTTTIWQGKKRPMAILHDITERKRAEKEINDKSIKLIKQLEKSEKQRIASLVVLNDLNKTTKELHLEINVRKQAENIQKTLYNISKAVNSTDNMQELYSKIKEFLGDIIDTTNFYVALYDEKTDMISLPFEVDEKDDFKTFPAGKAITKYVIKIGKPLLATKNVVKKLIEKGFIETVGAPSEIWLGVPLKVENKVIGVIAVQSYDDPNLYTEKDIEMLTFVSEEIALAINRKQAEEQIKKDLEIKNTMLAEIHHRVKNNLQIISSLLKLQSSHIEDKRALELFQNSRDRVKTMALIHDALYRSKDLTNIDFTEYVKKLATQIFISYGANSNLIKLKINIKDILLDISTAIPCGLIINELISNSLKYAFPEGRKGEINISFTYKNQVNTLCVKDNGIGISGGIDLENSSTLGFLLVTSLTKQINGTLKLEKVKGTSFKITFKKTNIKTFGKV